MRRWNSPIRLTIIGTCFTLLLVLGWWQRTSISVWYHVRQLAWSNPQERASRIASVVAFEYASVTSLLGLFEKPELDPCENGSLALQELATSWGPDDPRTTQLVEQLLASLDSYSTEGKRGTLRVVSGILHSASTKAFPTPLTRAAGMIVQSTLSVPEVRADTLILAGALVERVPQGQWRHLSRELAEKGLGAKEVEVRRAALQLTMTEPLRLDPELMQKAVPLLHDQAPVVRRAALVLLASARDIVSEDVLLPLLHDPDYEVQHLCEVALSSRGLQDRHIQLARLISDESPTARLKVLSYLHPNQDLDPIVWLRRLSQDPSPAVRAAAVRAAGLHPQLDLLERLQEMARNDPSETVRQNALHYLQRQKEQKLHAN